MKKTRTNRYSMISGNTAIKKVLIENYRLILILIVFTLGIIYSLLSYKYAHSGESALLSLLANQYKIKETQTFLECFYNTLTNYSVYFVVVFLFGLCAIGLPVLVAVPFIYGMSVGFQITYLYMSYQVKGIGYAALIVMPITIAFGLILLFSTNQACGMSWDILSAIQDGRQPKVTINVYLKRFLVFAVLILTVSAVFSLLNTGLTKLITL